MVLRVDPRHALHTRRTGLSRVFSDRKISAFFHRQPRPPHGRAGASRAVSHPHASSFRSLRRPRTSFRIRSERRASVPAGCGIGGCLDFCAPARLGGNRPNHWEAGVIVDAKATEHLPPRVFEGRSRAGVWEGWVCFIGTILQHRFQEGLQPESPVDQDGIELSCRLPR